MGLDDLAAIANATAKAAAVGCWRILRGLWPHAVLVADVLGAATSRPVEMTKAARRAGAGPPRECAHAPIG
jgi:hypothetical protein